MNQSVGGWGIIGHEWAVGLLQRSLERGQVAQAYLIVGPPRVGKTTLALALARALNCTGEAVPCGQCRSCSLIAASRHPDVRLIEGGEVRAIRIDQVREVQREIALSPVEARQRVVILSDFQGATQEAANCLLKTLEEPPSQVVLILTASQVGRLLPTIVSRCQLLWLRPPTDQTIARGLEERFGVAPELASRLGRLAAGRVGWAVEAARNGTLLTERQERLEQLVQIMRADVLGRLRWARDLSGEGNDLPALLDLWTGWWRDLLLWRVGCRELVVNVDQEESLATAVRGYGVPELLSGLRALGEARRRLDSNANPRLTLEVLFLTLGQSSGDRLLGEG